jgi:flavin-dependent thymidylate synthase
VYNDESKGHYEIVRPPAFQVDLLSVQSDAAPLLATLAEAYTGKYTPDLTLGLGWIDEISKTALQTPLEFINTVFLLQNVTRAFTHQLVRTRIGVAYVQESMRFATMDKIKVLATKEIDDSELPTYELAARAAISAYLGLVRRGVPRQAARGILPTNVLTHVYWSVNLRTLQTVMRQRLCCQADHNEWVPILLEMRKQLIYKIGPEVKPFLLSNKERGEACGYGASFDRPCTWDNGPEDIED